MGRTGPLSQRRDRPVADVSLRRPQHRQSRPGHWPHRECHNVGGLRPVTREEGGYVGIKSSSIDAELGNNTPCRSIRQCTVDVLSSKCSAGEPEADLLGKGLDVSFGALVGNTRRIGRDAYGLQLPAGESATFTFVAAKNIVLGTHVCAGFGRAYLLNSARTVQWGTHKWPARAGNRLGWAAVPRRRPCRAAVTHALVVKCAGADGSSSTAEA